MRAFIACVPPAADTEKLVTLCAEIRRIAPMLRCEHADKLHFTLEFLGEKTEAWMLECRAVLIAGLASVPSLTVSINRIGFFPAPAHPRIIWAGSHPDENTALCDLASHIKRLTVGLGHVADPKPFHPHITLSRVKVALPPDAAARIARIQISPIEFRCDTLSVIKSTLSPSGSRYETLESISLNGAG
ncbi:MAG TPA: RNA 2',3'-cyclic phosphodiesterase [Bacteroidota bacterium]|nr:RNA 2',3'-cyclic phosphodiesterase [Bacteroidota bacterium]